ncbi:MAG: arylsulfatase [Kiritimatiellaeota bacterium]|nr:arylsulfatase [Kiritimatiellota bacterium]
MGTHSLKRIAAFAVIASAFAAAAAPRQPNVLIIVVDDMGFSDLGCFGGEIETPALDALAADGLRFTQCYNTARCWPTRSALMTGYYPQQTRSDPVRGPFPQWVRTLPRWLAPAGYACYHSGKWHVNGAPKPVADGGFDRSYILHDHDRHFNPKNHALDDKPLPPVGPGTNYYTTAAITDHALRCLEEHAAQRPARPFFAYVAYTAPHFPLHAPEDDIAPFRARYAAGWEAVRAARHARMTRMGIVSCALSAPESAVGPPYHFPDALMALGPGEVNRPLPWDSLTAPQRAFQSQKMAVHAAMIHRVDREVGRILGQVRRMGAWDDTLILFLSDNGASAEIMVRGDGHDPDAPMGSAASYLCLGPGWSTVANTPLRRHKTWVHEGGTSTPLIAHWPAGIADRNALRRDICHVIDFVPTVLDLAGVTPDLPPGAPPFPGVSLVPAFAKDGALARGPLYFSHEDNRALRDGDHKIVSAKRDGGGWELYDLAADRCEQRNLAAEHPGRVAELADRWAALDAQFRRDADPPQPKQ